MFVSGKPSKPSLRFAGKARAYLCGASGIPLWGRLLASPTNIRRSRKGFEVTNTLAYYEHSLITTVKSLIKSVPGEEHTFDVRDLRAML